MSKGGPHAELVALHRALYERQRAEIEASLHRYTKAFREYEAAYLARAARYRGVIDHEEVVRRAAAVDLVYVGDYHTLKQSQKAFVRLVERALGRGRPVALGLEFVQGVHQKDLDAFLKGRLSEATFLRRIDYPEHHVFDIWPNFRPMFELARDLLLPVVALDLADASLARRDRYAAERLAGFLAHHPGHVVLVLTGQLHVAPAHLPAAVDEALAEQGLEARKSLVVYQNCEEIYWQLTAKGLEHTVEAVEITAREVALVNTSPVVAQQSYLAHLHHDDPLDYSLETAPERTFKAMCAVLCKFLEIEVGDALEGVSVFSLGDLSFLEDLRRAGNFDRGELDAMKRQILMSESYYIPRASLVYLGTLSVNHAAEEAAHFIRHVITDDDGERDGLVDAFYARVINEALAFFASKVINHRRKTAHARDLEALLARWEAGEREGLVELEVRAARVVLDHLAIERGKRVRGFREVYGEADADLFNAVTHLLGYILGDKLYYGMIRGRTTKKELRELFLDPLDEEGAVFHTYFYLAQKVRAVRVPRA